MFDAITYSAVKRLALGAPGATTGPTPAEAASPEIGMMSMVPSNFSSEYYVDTGTQITADNYPELVAMFPPQYVGSNYGEIDFELPDPIITDKSPWWVGKMESKTFFHYAGKYFLFHGKALSVSSVVSFATYETTHDFELIAYMGDQLLVKTDGRYVVGTLTSGAFVEEAETMLSFIPCGAWAHGPSGDAYVLTESGSLFKTSNLLTWSRVSTLPKPCKHLMFGGGKVIASSDDYFYTSSDGGVNWDSVNLKELALSKKPAMIGYGFAAPHWHAPSSKFLTYFFCSYAATNDLAYIHGASSDDGITWSSAESFLNIVVGTTVDVYPLAPPMATYGDTAFGAAPTLAGSGVVSYNSSGWVINADTAYNAVNRFWTNGATLIAGANFPTVYHVGAVYPNTRGYAKSDTRLIWGFRPIGESETYSMLKSASLAAPSTVFYPLPPATDQLPMYLEVGSKDMCCAYAPLYPPGCVTSFDFYISKDDWVTKTKKTYSVPANQTLAHFCVGTILSAVVIYHHSWNPSATASHTATNRHIYKQINPDTMVATSTFAPTSTPANFPWAPTSIVVANWGTQSTSGQTSGTIYQGGVIMGNMKVNIATGFANITSGPTDICVTPRATVASSGGGVNSLYPGVDSWTSAASYQYYGSLFAGSFMMPDGKIISCLVNTLSAYNGTSAANTREVPAKMTVIIKDPMAGTTEIVATTNMSALGEASAGGSYGAFYASGILMARHPAAGSNYYTSSDNGVTWSVTQGTLPDPHKYPQALWGNGVGFYDKHKTFIGVPLLGKVYEVGTRFIKAYVGGGGGSFIPEVSSDVPNTKWVIRVK